MQWSGKRPIFMLRYLDAEQEQRVRTQAVEVEEISINQWICNAINAALEDKNDVHP